MALVASVGIHWLLQQGLARTVLDIRPLEGLLPLPSTAPPEVAAADFPLRIDPSQRASFAHEQPLEMPLAIDAAAPAGKPAPPAPATKPAAGAALDPARAPLRFTDLRPRT
jgi:hypothetical protein